jgi:RNA polymerase sigma-70 factor (ECF subfamily)
MDDPRTAEARLSELMRLAQGGGAVACSDLLEAIAPRIRHVVQRRRGLAGADTVEDIVQDVPLSVHAVHATYDTQRPFTPRLPAIVRHRLADHARRHFRQAAHELAAADAGVTFDEVAADIQEEETVDMHALSAAIHALPAGQRQAIEFLTLEEMSPKEASTRAGLSIGGHRAMLTLRKTLGRQTNETEQLMANLTRDARAVRPLGRPWRRTAACALAAFVYLNRIRQKAGGAIAFQADWRCVATIRWAPLRSRWR